MGDGGRLKIIGDMMLVTTSIPIPIMMLLVTTLMPMLMQLVRTHAMNLAEPLERQNRPSLKLLLKDSTSGES